MRRALSKAVTPDEWPRLDAIYRQYAGPRNGPIHRVEPWWRQNVLRHYDETTAELGDNEAFVWKNADGEDEGYVSYYSRTMPRTGPIRAVGGALSATSSRSPGDAYLGLWQHLLDARPRDATGRPHAGGRSVRGPRRGPAQGRRLPRAEGPMVRVVDVERALGRRPFVGSRPVSFTMRVTDTAAPWNDGVWRIEAGEGQMRVEMTSGRRGRRAEREYAGAAVHGLHAAGSGRGRWAC